MAIMDTFREIVGDEQAERFARCAAASNELHRLGVRNCKAVYFAWSAEEADWPCMTIIYVAGQGRPKTALINGDDITIMDGWNAPK